MSFFAQQYCNSPQKEIKQLIKNYPTEKVYINFIQKNCLCL